MNSYDKDGFFVLIPRKTEEKPKQSTKRYGIIGEHKLIKTQGDLTARSHNMQHLKIVHNGQKGAIYTVDFAPKAWQYKAWRMIGRGIKWSAPLQFNKCNNDKVKHIKRFAVSLRVYSEGKKKSRYVHDQIANDSSMYVIADTFREFKTLLEDIYRMLTVNAERYEDESISMGYSEFTYVLKAMIIYDDYSYDAVMGNPYNLYRTLNIDYSTQFDNKGRLLI